MTKNLLNRASLIKFIFGLFLLQLVLVPAIFSQGQPYQGPDDPAGDDAAIREGYMDGNRIFLYFQNTTELAKWVDGVSDPLWSRWPNNPSGVRMLDGVGLLIGAKVSVIEGDSIPVTNPAEIERGYTFDGRKIKSLYFLQTSYREEMDTAPTGFPEWGLYPVFGYFNEASETPAMSDDSTSWPPEGWPSADGLKWPGEWNGRFGRGVQYADLETYFVANDAQDQEYLGIEDITKYYPRPGVRIGDKRPSTIQNGLPWGGIGVRVSQRGFQWNNPQARDAIFWEYSIANISDYDLPEVAFGYWVDNGIGGEADDELGYFDTNLDMAYSWDSDGIGLHGLATGTMGFAYLESPGLAYDGIDNDNDGLTDEKRDNPAGMLVGPYYHITDLSKFLETYKLTEADLREHYEGDEDQDWENGVDLNGNGTYAQNIGTAENPIWVLEPGESAGDDVGLDGVGPTELNYRGPDQGEGNGMPDFIEGVGCEPNFAALDVSESDMVGLTSFRLFPVPSHSSSYRWFRGDESMWELIGQDSLVEYLGKISNLIETFASGPFPLYQGREERISMSELHSYDPLEGLTLNYSAPALFKQKQIVQVIYEKDYRFAQPPKMPTLTATPGDGRVILTWDDVADTRTREPILGNINDFEGYKLFRATDKYMADAEVITDGYGTPKYLKPIFQCDLKDGKFDFTNFGMTDGVGYYLGSETGIVHHFIDTNVQNGRTYYYGIVAYDYGAPEIEPGIAPSENNLIIRLDEKDNVTSIGKNVAIVVPRPPAAGFVPPSIDSDDMSGLLGQGLVKPEIIAASDILNSHRYKVKFQIDTVRAIETMPNGLIYTTAGMSVYDITRGTDSLLYTESPQKFTYNNLKHVSTYDEFYADSINYWSFKIDSDIATDVFSGLRISMKMPYETAEYDFENSGWKIGNAAMTITPAIQKLTYFPWEYELIFTDDDSAYVGKLSQKNIRDEANNSIIRRNLIFNQAFNFYVVNKVFTDSTGANERLDLVVHDLNDNRTFDILEDRILAGPVTPDGQWAATVFSIDFRNITDISQMPKSGDTYYMTYNRPFWITDSVTFTVNAAGELDTGLLRTTMDAIKVVPNPYIATNTMEPALRSSSLNQQRRLMFTHLPAECLIKIFTSSGMLVNEIEVKNTSDDGIAHWDLLTKEGLEIAAGIYLYHIEAIRTGDKKMGKFAVVK